MTEQPKKYQKKHHSVSLYEGKIPPQAVDLEEAVLGASMLEQDAYLSIAHILKPEYFYKEAHQIIFRAIETLSGQNNPIDIITVADQLKQSGELDLVGGPYYITKLTNPISSAANIEYHSYILYQKYIAREMIRKCSEIIQAAFEDTFGFDELRHLYSSATVSIDDLLAGRRADKSMADIMQYHLETLNERFAKSQAGDMVGIPTGIVHLNRKTHGWNGSDLVIIAARPSMGKTAVALNLFTKHAATRGKNTLFFSLEMSDVSLADRLVCSFGGIDAGHLKSGKLSEEEWDLYHNASASLQKLPIFIDDGTRVDLKHITAVSRSKKRKGKCDLIVIDYLQLIETYNQNGYNKNREREVAEISRGLKLLAKELDIPVILLCQLSRAVESRGGDKEPQLSDLRESGAIEQDADIVIFPYRPEYYKIMEDAEGKSLSGVMKLIIAKNRNGNIGEVYLKYSPDLTQFFDYDITDIPF